MDIGKIFPSRYLRAGDLDGKDVPVTIKEVKVESVGQSQTNKPVLFFKGADKGLVLNVTNSKRIAAIAHSEDTDDWPGTRIVLYSTETEFQGDTVECIRVRMPKAEKPKPVEPVAGKKKAKAKTVEELDDEIPESVKPTAVPVEEDFDPDDEDRVPF